MDSVAIGFLIMALVLAIGVLSKNLRFMYVTGLSGCAYMVVGGIYQFFHLEIEWMAWTNLVLAVFGVWLGWKYVTDRLKFKKEEARLMKLIEECKRNIADMLDSRRN